MNVTTVLPRRTGRQVPILFGASGRRIQRADELTKGHVRIRIAKHSADVVAGDTCGRLKMAAGAVLISRRGETFSQEIAPALHKRLDVWNAGGRRSVRLAMTGVAGTGGQGCRIDGGVVRNSRVVQHPGVNRGVDITDGYVWLQRERVANVHGDVGSGLIDGDIVGEGGDFDFGEFRKIAMHDEWAAGEIVRRRGCD